MQVCPRIRTASFDFASLTLRYAQDERRKVITTVRPERSDAKRREVEGQFDYSDTLLVWCYNLQAEAGIRAVVFETARQARLLSSRAARVTKKSATATSTMAPPAAMSS